MPFIKPIDGISAEDLESLVASGSRDARTVEFQRELPALTEAGQFAFLSEIASFANGTGGHLLYGVTAREGASAHMTGVARGAAEAALNWLEQAAWSGISPRIPGLRLKLVEIGDERVVLTVRVPKTWAGPHMVSYRETNQFYSRNPHGKYLMAIDELRAAFSLGHTLAEKMRAFRLDRLNAILTRTLSIQLTEAPKTVLHILPVSAFGTGQRISMDDTLAAEAQAAKPMEARSLTSNYNYDGLITFSSQEKYAYSYVQLFRNGCIEATESLLLQPKDGRKHIPSALYEREVIGCGERLLTFLHNVQIDPPYVVMLSFLGVRGYGMFVSSIRWQAGSHEIDRDNLYLDDVVIEEVGQSFARTARPMFDQVWNSCGWARSLNYDEQGNWREFTG